MINVTIFLDTANIEEIKEYSKWGIIFGVTTNQKIWLKEKGIDFKEKLKEILDFMNPFPVSVELTKTNKPLHILIKEAKEYVKLGSNAIIKVPMWKNGNGLYLASSLKENSIPVNMTCCMSVNQAILACEVGARYVSLFYNRIIDYETKGLGTLIPLLKGGKKLQYLDSGQKVVTKTRKIINQQGYGTEIICGSIRDPKDVEDCFSAGAHIVTITPKILKLLPFHPKTESTILEFDAAWRTFLKK